MTHESHNLMLGDLVDTADVIHLYNATPDEMTQEMSPLQSRNIERKDADSEEDSRPKKSEVSAALDEEDTRCGLGRWQPQWLQRIASKKTYVIVFGAIGIMMGSDSYLIATLSTLEKRFKIPSKVSGMIYSSFQVGVLLAIFPVAYLGGRHKPRAVAIATMVAGLGCLMMATPHAYYGPGQDARQLTLEYGASVSLSHNQSTTGGFADVTTCGANVTTEEDCVMVGGPETPTAIFCLSHLLIGMSNSAHFTLGTSYLDDNTRKNKAPIVLAVSHCLGMLGPTFGYTLATYTLGTYVDPSLHPVIDNDDPRWIGAWWMGWLPFSAITFVLGLVMLMFPKHLPRAAMRKSEELAKTSKNHTSFKDFKFAITRVVTNKLLLFNTLSVVLFVFGFAGYWTFMPKYLETQYGQSAVQASMISGTMGLVFTGLGVMASALVICRFKPRPRTLAAWCVLVELADVVCYLSWSFLGCPSSKLQGSWATDHSWNLAESCNVDCGCGPNINYSPVCSIDGTATYYSPCHAGCTSVDDLNGTKVYGDCRCIAERVATNGPCLSDCTVNFTIFLASQCLMRFLQASSRAGNALLTFRCVEERDKSLAIAFSEFMLCGLASIPAPIIYGTLMDSACIVWGQTCGQTGNCWLYDEKKLRQFFNYMAAGCMLCGTLLDIAVWFLAEGLPMYDEDIDQKKKEFSPSHDPKKTSETCTL